MAVKTASRQRRGALLTFAECRDWRHAWTAHDARVEKRVIHRSLRCLRCGMLKKQTMNMSADVLTTRYVAPDGYYLKGGRMTDHERRDVRKLTSGLELD